MATLDPMNPAPRQAAATTSKTIMKSKTEQNIKVAEQKPHGGDAITSYANAQVLELAAICRTLRTEIDAALPKATSKIWHAIPVWFIGENPVVGFSVTAKKNVNLLFWNGQSFDEQDLKPAGKFKAAQIQFGNVSEINPKMLRRWLKKAGTEIWDHKAMRKGK